MLRHPLTGPDAIRDRQEVIRYFAARGYQFSVPAQQIEAVQAYLDSNFDTLSRGRVLKAVLESSWIALRYRDLLDHARTGILDTRKLVAGAQRQLEALDRDDAPPAVRSLHEDLACLVERVGTDRLQRAESARAVLVVDRELRTALRDDLRQLLLLLAEFDAMAAAAVLLQEGYGLSEIVEDSGPVLEGEGIWHPFLPEGTRNPVSLRGGQTLVFLTGPNMAGKTTYLKAVGLCIYLAQCGLPVPAKRFALAPVDHLVTGLTPEDNLREGISYFLAEVRRVKDVVRAVAAGRRTIGIFDEVFRGTNVTDALEASKTVLVGCSKAEHSTFIFSSHLVELADELRDLDSVEFRYFDGELRGQELSFDYELRTGVSSKRFGMELLRREGLPDLLAEIPNASIVA
jgi:DNA mismatch repair ATPase MutS